MKSYVDITDSRIVKALAHPLRVRILGILEERTASPSEMAAELDAPLGSVSYHVRTLASLGLVKLVKKTPRRGAIEHHYRADARPSITDEAWAEVPAIVKEAMIGAWLDQVRTEINAAASAGGFRRSDAHASRTELVLDEQGWRALSRELAQTLRRVDAIHGAAAKRLAKRDHEAELRASLVMMLFESAGSAGDGRPEHSRRRVKARVRASS